MRIHPITDGNAASLMVFSLPILSIRKPEINEPTGIISTIILATRDVMDWVTSGISLSGLSSWGIMMAENARHIPMMMWKEAAIIDENICENIFYWTVIHHHQVSIGCSIELLKNNWPIINYNYGNYFQEKQLELPEDRQFSTCLFHKYWVTGS